MNQLDRPTRNAGSSPPGNISDLLSSQFQGTRVEETELTETSREDLIKEEAKYKMVMTTRIFLNRKFWQKQRKPLIINQSAHIPK